MPDFAKALLASAIRHAMTVVAGSLAAAGYLSGDEQTALIADGSGLLLLAASLAWSYASKKLHQSKEA
jgi:hypothetical protein